MSIKKISKYRTDDGEEHSSIAAAEQYVANEELRNAMQDAWSVVTDAQDVLNFLSCRRTLVRNWLDKCDALEREANKP